MDAAQRPTGTTAQATSIGSRAGFGDPASLVTGKVGAGAIGLLAFLLLIHILCHVDRNLVAAFGPQLVSELGLSHTEFSIITGLAFSSVYSIAALAAGMIADRVNRARVAGAGLTVWSVFTGLSGLAQGFLSLLAARPFVAVGEATLVPTATAMLAARFPFSRLATAAGIFFMGIPLGIGGSYIIAARLGPLIGWRYCFVMLGAIGVVLAALTLLIRDVRPAQTGAAAAKLPVHRMLRDCAHLLRDNPTARWSFVALVVMHAHLAGGPFTQLWLVNDRGLPAATAGQTFGLMVIVFGTLGAAAAGLLSDWAVRRFPISRAAFLGGYVALLAPFVVAYRLVPPDHPLFQVGMAASVLFFSGFYGPAFALMQRDVPDHLRSTITGLAIITLNVLAMGLLSIVIGVASDALRAQQAAQTLTWPLLAADVIGLSSMLFLFAIARGDRRGASPSAARR